ncbi:flagellar filament capping protein FliD [Nitratidesulfovibrio vulgaris]|uniref:Flagellar hook-associated protein 2 n=1 Tax=Nitratidesulfovibrio vulgaris (strain DP4) TaxID=391774 RepID=A0A0H3A9S6_NITV4|nr:flagellar filament capping protein FliD [Nitratidesulfovibrio vulgaris]ABM29135.1 flagellar hook-associated 2 domain protein [Nitratidesulfovibrio vulgaris DP4]GEB81306.1 flagellar hook-associated protein 2 [Desulfovibrio desulfuricans]
MADYLSGSINFTGLGGGVDFAQVIDGLKKIEQVPMNRLTLWKADWQRRKDAFGDLRTELATFKNVVDGMDTLEEFLVKTASSSNAAVATATTSSAALEGTYRIEVNKLASNGIWTFNDTFADKTQQVNTSTTDQSFVYTYKGTTRTMTVPPGTTLDGLKNIINNDPQNPGVRASLVQNGNAWTFQMHGMDLGSEASLTIDASTNLSKLPGNDPTKWQTQQATDAEFRVNGWPATGWLKSTSNTVSNVIEGLNISLKDVGTTQLTVATDIEKIKEKITAFVDGMNAVRSKITEQTKVDSNKATISADKSASLFQAQKGSILTGNYGVQLISSRLKTAIADKSTGFEYQYKDGNINRGDIYSSLAQIGILTNAEEGNPNYGLLTIDQEKLDAALKNNPTAVAELFAADGIGVSDSPDFSYQSKVNGVTKAGIYDVSYEVDASGKIVNAVIDGRPAKVDDASHTLTSMDGNSRGLLLQVDNLAPGSYSSRVRIKQGKAADIDGMLTDMLGKNGTLAVLENNYTDIMDDIDKKIESETSRIEKWERTMRNQFATLSATLARYDQLNQSLQSQITQLSKQ